MGKWIDRDTKWISGSRRRARNRRLEKVYKVSDVADLLSVDIQTVKKWLALDEPEGAVIPPEGWYRLPNSGHIRIREWVVRQLLAEEM